jgi:hypothetical protein
VPVDVSFDPGASIVRGNANYAVTNQKVSCVSLDSYVAQHRITSIRLVKIDVEGAEDLVLKGASHTLRQLRPTAVIVEHAPLLLLQPEARWSSIVAIMQSASYSPYSIMPNGDLRPLGNVMPSDAVQNICFKAV